jgi:hypothetical protein
MKQLHTSYSNLGSWRQVRDPLSGVIRFQFDQKRGVLTSILLFTLCMLAAMWLASIRSNTGNDGARIAAVWILAATGVIIPLIIVFHGVSEQSKGDLIRYCIDQDVLELPRIGQSIDNARRRVSFSSENYTNRKDHFYELNIVLDGQRMKFLSSNLLNGFRSITKPLEAIGFAVSYQKIKI